MDKDDDRGQLCRFQSACSYCVVVVEDITQAIPSGQPKFSRRECQSAVSERKSSFKSWLGCKDMSTCHLNNQNAKSFSVWGEMLRTKKVSVGVAKSRLRNGFCAGQDMVETGRERARRRCRTTRANESLSWAARNRSRVRADCDCRVHWSS